MKRLNRMEADFEQLESKVNKLLTTENEIKTLDVTGFEQESQAIKDQLRNLDTFDEIESEFALLKNMISKKQESDIKNLIYKIEILIDKSKKAAYKNKDSSWLGNLITFEDKYFLTFKQQFEASEINGTEARAVIKELWENAETLSIPPSKEETTHESKEEPQEHNQNYYETLGIKQNATFEQVKDMYRKLVNIYHPDHGEFLGVDGDKKFKEINEAYQTLIDPVMRKEYDDKLGEIS